MHTQSCIKIDEKRYAIDQLPADVAGTIENIHMADSVVQLRRDKVLLLCAAACQLSSEPRHHLTDALEAIP